MRTHDEMERHYAELLAPVYVWMLGGEEAAGARARSFVADHRLALLAPGIALDLGSGPGFHALALANAGFETIAVDSSREFSSSLRDARVRKVCGDFLDLATTLQGRRARVILCLGDTLTHLESEEQVDELLDTCAHVLAPGGVLALTFRDYTLERKPSECLIRVREDSERSLTCALEFEPERVRVTDILHQWRDGRWIEYRSSYSKLRLSPGTVRAKLLARGFVLQTDAFVGGLATLIASRP